MCPVVGPTAGDRRHSGRCGFTVVELLVSTAIIVVLMSLLLPAIQDARDAARRTTCRSHLRQIGLALHNFHDVHRSFPASGWTKPGPGNPLGCYIGWRALILPYLEQSALFADYDFDADWWSAENRAAGSHGVPVYRCPSVPGLPAVTAAIAKPPRPALTFAPPLARADYEALMGIRRVIDPERYPTTGSTRAVMYRNSTTRFADITDGTSHSVVITECGGRPAVFRGRSLRADLRNDQGYGWIDSESAFSLDGSNRDGSQQGLGPSATPRALNATNENEPYSFHAGGANVLFADGHVRFVSESIALDVFAALVTRGGGEVAVVD